MSGEKSSKSSQFDPEENDILWRYCSLAASKLRARRLSDSKFNFKCNVCGDGKRKRRGYLVYDHKRELVYYKCFNEGDCAAAGDGNAWHGSKWLKYTDENLYEAYRNELKDTRLRRYFKPSLKIKKKPELNFPNLPRKKEEAVEKSDLEKLFESFVPVKKCPERLKKVVKDFLVGRKIPIERAREMRIALEGKYRDRIAIPSYDANGKLVYFQARALLDQTPKYLNSVMPREKVLYGLERVDKSKPVVVLEGPIDSMFVENAVATMGCSYPKETQEILDGFDCWYLMDNDRAGNSKSRELLESGRKIFIWDKFLEENGLTGDVKDINDFVKTTGAKTPLTIGFLEKYFTNSPFSLTRLTK